MAHFFLIFMALAMAAVLVSLGMGIYAMIRGGGIKASRFSNKMMQWRVILQGLAILFFALAMWFSGRLS